MMSEKKCMNCTYFDCVNTFCRCNPPIPTIKKLANGDTKIIAMFPIIKRPDTDWCGEFEDKRKQMI